MHCNQTEISINRRHSKLDLESSTSAVAQQPQPALKILNQVQDDNRHRGFTLIESIGQVQPDASRKKAGNLSGSHPTYKNCSAFTLIELLVVVLIIGILAAVALPQYQKAVRKSRAVQVKTLLRSIQRAQHLCNLERGTTNSTECALLSNLDIDIPFSCTEPTALTTCTIGPCAWNNTCELWVMPGAVYIKESLSNATLFVNLSMNSDSFTFGGGGAPGFNVNDYTWPYKD